MDAKKDYSHVVSGYRNELRLNGKATLSAYCRSVGVSISAVHHWMENYGITTKKIKAEVAELAGCDSPFVPLSSEMPVPVRSSSRIELTFPNGVLLSADQYPPQDLLPKSDLASAAGYLDMEWDAVVDIFKRGDTNLDNNLVERMNRYFSMSRRSSLFFGSHSGAERAAVLYTLALSAKTNHINLFDYIVDILDKTAMWQPNTPLNKYRELLPDRWATM